MRIVRVPYFYLPTIQLKNLHRKCHRLLNVIRDIHLDIPNDFHNDEEARHYQYYPAFIRWAHNKCVDEMLSRGIKHRSPLGRDILGLKSRSMDNFLPPTDLEIAQDVVYLLQSWRFGKKPGGKELPLSYLELAKNTYGYSPSEAYLKGVREIPGYHYHADSGWYNV